MSVSNHSHEPLGSATPGANVNSPFNRFTLALAQKRGDTLWAAVAGVVCVSCWALVSTFPWGRDQSIYALVGHGLLQGQVPYRDLWDFKPPGIYFVYAAAEALFGHSMRAIRWLEVTGLAGTLGAFIVLSRRFHGKALAGWFAGAILALAEVLLDFWHTAQPETFGGMLTVVALALIVPGEQARTHGALAFLAGLLIGGAGLMKPQLAGAVVVLLAYVLRQAPELPWWQRLRPALALAAGFGLSLGLCASYFIVKHAWADLWWTMHDFVPGYTALGWDAGQSPLGMLHHALLEALVKFSVYITLGVAALVLMPAAHPREHEGVFLVLGLVVLHAVGIALQAKFFEYHYGGTLPLLALLAGLGWAKLWWGATARGTRFVLAFTASALVAGLISTGATDLPGTCRCRTRLRLRHFAQFGNEGQRQPLDAAIARVAGYDLAANRDVARWMKGQTGPADHVLVWGFEPAVYWFAERAPATRFIYNVPQRTVWQRQTAQNLFMKEVRRTRPAVIAVQHADIFPAVTGSPNDSAGDLPEFAELAHMLNTEYFPAGYRFNFDYFHRR